MPSAAEEADDHEQEKKTPGQSNIDPVAIFQRIYPKAARMQAPLALIGGASSLYAFLNSADADEKFVSDTTSGLPWLYSGVLMGSLVPCAWLSLTTRLAPPRVAPLSLGGLTRIAPRPQTRWPS